MAKDYQLNILSNLSLSSPVVNVTYDSHKATVRDAHGNVYQVLYVKVVLHVIVTGIDGVTSFIQKT